MRQRGEAWELRVYVGRDPESGRRRYVNKTVRGGKREVERALAAMVAEVDRGGLRDSKASVAELLERWFEHAREDFSPSTERETRAILDGRIVPSLGTVPLQVPCRTWAGYRSIRTSTVNVLRSSGFALLPTGRRPHFTVVLPDREDSTLARFDGCFGPVTPNPGR